ncbi:hypothetical protein GOEFS_062_00070 [Gordonia effusa NBRC 100432]|uniref:DUF1330 domain-containing protein n=1 Tax=Gordonia effusa NBRC 100432 TaxID=1077974 RepID=H0R0U7_9ACTN|nr:hypothetical protein [Gordonia effusa]GAB18698.1 hypothetical protein GOEFS_062_00070 [Gordonia effusa NBRC 100432]
MNSDEITLCCMLWAHPGQESALTEYEDTVLALLPEFGAQVRQRVIGSGANGHPNEVQILSCPTQAALDAYLADPRRTALTSARDAAIARTELFPVRLHL